MKYYHIEMDPSKYTVKMLKDSLSLGLPTTGNRSELLLRLSQAEGFDTGNASNNDGKCGIKPK